MIAGTKTEQPYLLTVAILCTAVLWMNPSVSDAASNPYLEAVKKFADTVLEHGRDQYGETHTPLFVDGLHSETLEPAIWKFDGAEWVTSNFANQQPLMQVLDGLTGLTGDAQYREAAEAAAAYMLENASPFTGLLAWGDHVAWDLVTDDPVGTQTGRGNRQPRDFQFVHDLKTYPYFDLMWRVNPEATRRLMFAIWGGHITDWKTLDYNRHASTHRLRADAWPDADVFDEESPLPAPGSGRGFAGVSTYFLHTSIDKTRLDGSEEALLWSRRLMEQWQRNRHPDTGISGGQTSWQVGGDRAQQALDHLFPDINEATLLATYHHGRYTAIPLALLEQAERMIPEGGALAETGREFVSWAVDDLATYAREAYDPERMRFRTILTDGTMITEEHLAQARPGYYTADDLLPLSPGSALFRGYAKAWKVSRDPIHWDMLMDLGRYFGLGEFGNPDGRGRQLAQETDQRDWRLIYGLIDLYESTGDDGFIETAKAIADNWLAIQTPTGLFPRPAPQPRPRDTAPSHEKIPGTVQPDRVYARTGDEVPLALLHLAAVLEGRYAEMPQPPTNTQRFHVGFHGPLEGYQSKRDDPRTFDYLVYYGPDLYW